MPCLLFFLFCLLLPLCVHYKVKKFQYATLISVSCTAGALLLMEVLRNVIWNDGFGPFFALVFIVFVVLNLIFTMFIGFPIFLHRSSKRLRDYHLCFNCGYDVRASVKTGRCPECGEELDLEQVAFILGKAGVFDYCDQCGLDLRNAPWLDECPECGEALDHRGLSEPPPR